MPATLHITGDPDADELLATDSLALLVGMLLDQQIAMEIADIVDPDSLTRVREFARAATAAAKGA